MSTYLSSLLEWLLVNSDEDDGVWTETVCGGGLDVLDNVGALGEVDEGLRAQLLQAHLLLLIAGIDGDHSQTHSLGVLLGKGTETTTGTDNGDGLAGTSTRLLQTLVDGDTCAENRSDGSEIAVLWYPSNMSGLGNAVLLEGSVNGVAGKKRMRA